MNEWVTYVNLGERIHDELLFYIQVIVFAFLY